MYIRTRRLRRWKLVVVESMLKDRVVRRTFHLTMKAAERETMRRLRDV
jgi:hypothetical protein